MENKNVARVANTNNNANETSHYVLMTIGIAIGMLGVVLRFLSDWEYMDLIANFIFIIGTIASLKAVVDILK
jgi:hypothetical protein